MTHQHLIPMAASLSLVLTPALAPLALAADVPPTLNLATQAAPLLMHARVWQPGRSPAGYLVSEKYDGVRAVWDGSKLRFRSGLPIPAPAWFVAGLPAIPLDGELWLGRGQFERLVGIVRHSVPVDADWHELRYMIFDLPGSQLPFAERAAYLADVVQAAALPWLQAAPQQPMGSVSALQSHLKQLVQTGAEGLVLHRANALWSPGRSDAVHKLKPMPDDEARVVAHLPGKGRHAGRLGALLLEQPSGQRFAVGSGLSDAQRDVPPAIGTWVTYRYRSFTRTGVPRFASFLRERAPE